jgi:segregation and condensation protein B
MPNKNIKKRRRVVMTSDVVPAGSHVEISPPEVKTDQVPSTDAAPISQPAAREADASDASVTTEASPSINDEPTDGAATVNGALDGSSDASGEAVMDEARADALDGDSVAGDAADASVVSVVSEDANADEVTEPAAKGDELWTPEEVEAPATTVPAADLSRAHLKGLIEALVFVADQPVSLNEIAKAAGRADRKLVKALAEELRQDYARRGIHLDEVAGGLIFRTNPAYGPFIRDVAAKKPVRMTRAQLETLAIIAYRQPLTRPEVDEVRGVDSGPVMKMLLERDLIKILGKKDEPGRPLLYGTTPAFLEFFGLKALKDLPSLREFTELNEDSRRAYDKEMGDSDAPTEPDLSTLAAAASAASSGARAEGEASSEPEPEPATMRPTEGAQGEWFERPTEPDTTVDALDPTSEADIQGADEEGSRDDTTAATSPSDDPDALASDAEPPAPQSDEPEALANDGESSVADSNADAPDEFSAESEELSASDEPSDSDDSAAQS